jgi:hypothetical protein
MLLMLQDTNITERPAGIKDRVGRNAARVMLALVLWGLLFQLLPLFAFARIPAVQVIRHYAEPVSLSYFGIRLFEYATHLGGVISFPDVVFYLTALIGAVVFIKTGARERRLLRFSFAVMLLSSLLKSVFCLILIFSVFNKMPPGLFLLHLLACCVPAGVILLSYLCLQYLDGRGRLFPSAIPPERPDLPRTAATRGQRFFNLVGDSVCCILVFSLLFRIFPRLSVGGGDNTGLYVMMYACRSVYYVFFEALFGATPAKFLSETRTLNVDGSVPGFGKIVLRTLCRFVPFEPFSFFGEKGGWHDRWTDTVVVRNRQTGIGGGRYFLLIPLFVALGLAGAGVRWGMEKYDTYLYEKNRHEQKVKAIEHGLKSLSPRTIITLKDVDCRYCSDAVYLRPAEEEEDGLRGYAMFAVENDYRYSPVSIGEALDGAVESTVRVRIADSLLWKAFTKDYGRYREDRRNSADLLHDGKRYEITSVVTMYLPVIETGSMSYRRTGDATYIDVGLENHGWKARLTEIRDSAGAAVWENALPQEIEGATRESNRYRFSVKGTFTGFKDTYDILLRFDNDRGERKEYRLKGSGSDLDCSLTEVFPDNEYKNNGNFK